MKDIALFGFGTVGSGVFEILDKRKEEIREVLGEYVRIKYVCCLDYENYQGKHGDTIFTDDYDMILKDKDLVAIIEVTGALKVGRFYMLEAMKNGMAVITANKSVVSRYFEELQDMAIEKDLPFCYEASCGGTIPIIKPLKEEVYLNRVTEVRGIMNGTCNYLLSKMLDQGTDYNETLKEAQRLGYAEADPTDDVCGYDTRRKLRILSSLAFGNSIKEEDIPLEGIEKIKSYDIDIIRERGMTIKLLAKASLNEDNSYTALVEPTILKKDGYYSQVNDAYNSIEIEGDNCGILRFFGAGAGKLPTADAIVRDLLDVLTNSFLRERLNFREIKNANDQISSSYYLRIAGYEKKWQDIENDLPYDKLIERDGKIFLIFKDIKRKELFNMLEKYQIKEEDYFLASIED